MTLIFSKFMPRSINREADARPSSICCSYSSNSVIRTMLFANHKWETNWPFIFMPTLSQSNILKQILQGGCEQLRKINIPLSYSSVLLNGFRLLVLYLDTHGGGVIKRYKYFDVTVLHLASV